MFKLRLSTLTSIKEQLGIKVITSTRLSQSGHNNLRLAMLKLIISKIIPPHLKEIKFFLTIGKIIINKTKLNT